jgi:hypothetical protein
MKTTKMGKKIWNLATLRTEEGYSWKRRSYRPSA